MSYSTPGFPHVWMWKMSVPDGWSLPDQIQDVFQVVVGYASRVNPGTIGYFSCYSQVRSCCLSYRFASPFLNGSEGELKWIQPAKKIGPKAAPDQEPNVESRAKDQGLWEGPQSWSNAKVGFSPMNLAMDQHDQKRMAFEIFTLFD